jgi:hypothetical protein
MHPTTSRLLSRHCFHSLPLVACNITEDLHWQPAAIENIATPKTRSLCRDFKSSGMIRSPVITDGESAHLAENIQKHRPVR